MSKDNLTYVRENLLSKADIDDRFISDSLNILADREIDFGDIFFEHTVSESFSLDEGIIKGGSFNIISGVGVRAVTGEKCGFAYSDVIEKSAVQEACRAACAVSKGLGREERISILREQNLKPLYVQDNPIESMERRQKTAILLEADAAARTASPLVEQVTAYFSQQHRMIAVAETDGSISADVKPVVSLVVHVMVKNAAGRRETGFAATGGAYLSDRIIEGDTVKNTALEAVRSALVNLEAAEAPSGVFPVVLGSGWPGVLIHEAVGHGLEGDANYNKTSAYTGLIGNKVASESVTVIDDGTIPERRGSQSCDDEGTPAAHNVLIENGILKGYMHDRKSAMLMKCPRTGNGRRESYEFAPVPRMTNTYMMPGEYSKEEIISSVKKGIYAVNFHGGQVDITSGRFVFTTAEAYMIENGKITYPVRNATLSGMGFESMQKVSMVGNDLDFDRGIGSCGKAGQSVMVGIGQPTLKIDELVVGGTA